MPCGDVWLFPEVRRTAGSAIAEPRSRHTFKNWWEKAELLAELSRTEQWGWHSLRWKFAIELRHAPLRDVCDLGG